MIDLHSHILYEVDDGSKSIQESVRMLDAAWHAGFTHLVATPHYIKDTDYQADKESNRKKIVQLQNQRSKITLYLGNELYYDHNNLDLLKQGLVSTINDTCYVLVEVPFRRVDLSNFLKYVFQMQIAGYRIILAHAERYDFAQEDPNNLISLIERDVLIQINLSSLIGQYGKKAQKTVQILLDHNIVHFVATDAHQVKDYKNAYEILKKLESDIGTEKMEEFMMENPSHVLSNQIFYPESPLKIKSRKFFGMFKNMFER